MSPVDTILSRIKKLHALATHNPNPEEAASAAAKVQDMLFRHNLTMAQIETHEHAPSEQYDKVKHDLRSTTSTTGWRRSLLFSIARHNFCRAIYLSGTSLMEIVGKPSNVEVVIYMEDYLHREIERLARAAAKGQLYRKQAFITAFCRGAVATIVRRLSEQRKASEQAAPTSQALMVVADHALTAAFESYFPKVKSGRTSGRIQDWGAYSQGKQAGQSIGLHQGIKQHSSTRQLA